MSVSYQHPKVKVHVGDGFKFLDDYKNAFDVIITDSSDPEGPAEALFQKPYFQLLHDALRDGGVITTQGCTISYLSLSSLPSLSQPYSSHFSKSNPQAQKLTCVISTAENQWLHLPLITTLKKDCKTVFPNVEYAYTTIPTYPSGQIGFMVCSKDAKRDLKTPVRSFPKEKEDEINRYYNADIHRASFVLPSFARKALA